LSVRGLLLARVQAADPALRKQSDGWLKGALFFSQSMNKAGSAFCHSGLE
jgi:hypothetical protein